LDLSNIFTLPQSKDTHSQLSYTLTDPAGVIRGVNDAFLNLTGLTRNDLIGKPHNVVRHPEMPRSVFQLMWETIADGKPFSAFVQARSSKQNSIWTLATIVPNNDGYAGIRLTPTGPLFLAATSIYKDMLEVESRDGIQAARQFMFEQLDAIGYSNYDDFMTAALVEEMRLAESSLSTMAITYSRSPQPGHFHTELLLPASRLVRQIDALFSKAFKLTLLFSEIEKDMQEKSVFLSSLAGEIYERTALLKSVTADSSLIRAHEVIETFIGLLGRLNQSADSLLHLIKRSQYETSISSLQIKMLERFIEEGLESPPSKLPSEPRLELKNDLFVLCETTARHIHASLETVDQLPEAIAIFEKEVQGLIKFSAIFQNEQFIHKGLKTSAGHDLSDLLKALELATLTLEPEIADLQRLKDSLKEALVAADTDSKQIHALLSEKMELISRAL
jgi:PAS domain S-box-containing protein